MKTFLKCSLPMPAQYSHLKSMAVDVSEMRAPSARQMLVLLTEHIPLLLLCDTAGRVVILCLRNVSLNPGSPIHWADLVECRGWMLQLASSAAPVCLLVGSELPGWPSLKLEHRDCLGGMRVAFMILIISPTDCRLGCENVGTTILTILTLL